jgi:hypothetical protein
LDRAAAKREGGRFLLGAGASVCASPFSLPQPESAGKMKSVAAPVAPILTNFLRDNVFDGWFVSMACCSLPRAAGRVDRVPAAS